MSLDDPSHPTIIAGALRDLERDSASLPNGYRLLMEGGSGSSVYAFDLTGERVVLKVTLPSSAPALLVQARREAAFYRLLAPDVPLVVPRMLAASASTVRGVALLLGAEEPGPPVSSWTERDYEDIATQLGRLHGTFWGKTGRLDGSGWLRPDAPPAMASRCQRATRDWQVVADRQARPPDGTARRLGEVPGLVARLPGLGPPPALPATLCHGDCHPENLLRGRAGDWVWADWQSVRMGQGTEDLTFFWQRAEMADGRVPREAMLRTYLSALGATGAEVPTAREFEGALAWAELTSWLLDWPPFLAGVPVSRLEVVLDRIDDLTARLALGQTG